jgi:prevent-host-death family protein
MRLNILAIYGKMESKGAISMIVNSSEFQNNVGKYLELAKTQEIVITRNGAPLVRMLGMDQTLSFLADKLVGVVPPTVSEDEARDERLSRQ